VAGFSQQFPTECGIFSYGDQLWAWQFRGSQPPCLRAAAARGVEGKGIAWSSRQIRFALIAAGRFLAGTVLQDRLNI